MLKITCPYCGARHESEFICGGQSHIIRPEDPSSVSDVTWYAYLFERKNPKGIHLERWCHTAGCGQWFNIARDTVSHEILAVYSMSEPKPDLENLSDNSAPLSAPISVKGDERS